MFGYRTIVVGTDFSSVAERGVAVATALADGFEARRLQVVHVVPPATAVLPGLLGDARAEAAARRSIRGAEERLDEVSVALRTARLGREVRVGSPARELAAAADALSADLIVVASHGHGALARLVLGSATGDLIRLARCPVLVVGDKGPEAGRFERVLAAVDLSPISRNVLAHGLSVARAGAGALAVLSLYEPPVLAADPERLLPHAPTAAEVAQGLEAHRGEVMRLVRRLPRTGVPIDVEVAPHKGSTPAAILEVARGEGADLLVVGTSGHRALRRMILGSTAHDVLVRAPCPVLVVPMEERAPVRDPARSRAGALWAASPASRALGG